MYINNFELKLLDNGVETILVEGVHYQFVLEYVTGTRTTGHATYGAISIIDTNLSGILKATYQTVGGDQTVDRTVILSNLLNMQYNPRVTIWEALSSVPTSFPPTPHYQNYDQFYGQEEVVTALNGVKDAIFTASQTIADKLVL